MRTVGIGSSDSGGSGLVERSRAKPSGDVRQRKAGPSKLERGGSRPASRAASFGVVCCGSGNHQRTQPGTAVCAGPERAKPSGDVRDGRAETGGPNRERRHLPGRNGGNLRVTFVKVGWMESNPPGTAVFAGPERVEPSGDVREGRVETGGPNRCGSRISTVRRPGRSRTVG